MEEQKILKVTNDTPRPVHRGGYNFPPKTERVVVAFDASSALQIKACSVLHVVEVDPAEAGDLIERGPVSLLEPVEGSLVHAGTATEDPDGGEDDEDDGEELPEIPEDLSKPTIPQLTELAAAYGLEIPSGWNKGEIVEFLTANLAATEDPDGGEDDGEESEGSDDA